MNGLACVHVNLFRHAHATDPVVPYTNKQYVQVATQLADRRVPEQVSTAFTALQEKNALALTVLPAVCAAGVGASGG